MLKKAAEKERKDAPITVERKAEDALKKLDNAERKAVKTLEAEERLCAAQVTTAGFAAPLANGAAVNDEIDF